MHVDLTCSKAKAILIFFIVVSFVRIVRIQRHCCHWWAAIRSHCRPLWTPETFVYSLVLSQGRRVHALQHKYFRVFPVIWATDRWTKRWWCCSNFTRPGCLASRSWKSCGDFCIIRGHLLSWGNVWARSWEFHRIRCHHLGMAYQPRKLSRDSADDDLDCLFDRGYDGTKGHVGGDLDEVYDG